jgi:hypothetical protein
MRRRAARRIVLLLVLALLIFGALLLYGYSRRHPEDVPWTALDLSRPIGAFTGRKLAALHDDPPHCLALLNRAGIHFTTLPGGNEAPECSYGQAVRFEPGGAVTIGYRPAEVATQCPVAAALALWEWDVVEPAARRHFGRPVMNIAHFGSYNCRRMYGRATGPWSEHATANAIDVAGFTLDDGTTISVLRDWHDNGAKAAFLREVRDGACRLFSTVLSPDYNAAHANHLHLDEAPRGAWGWRACR